MAAFDWACAAVLLASMLMGAWRGLVYEIMSVLGWIASFLVAQAWAPVLATHLPMDSASEPLRYALAFVLLFVVGAFIGGFVATLVRRLTAAIGLRPVDRVLGAAFGIVRGVMLWLIVAVLIHMTAFHEDDWWRTSRSAPLSTEVLNRLRPVWPEEFRNYLP